MKPTEVCTDSSDTICTPNPIENGGGIQKHFKMLSECFIQHAKHYEKPTGPKNIDF